MSFDNVRRFLLYCVYAFGLPLTLTLITFLLSTFKLIPDKFNTNIGNGTCSMGINENDRTAQFIYVYFPIIITISINIIFYTITACKIYRVQKEISFKGTESKRHSKNEVEKARCENWYFSMLRLLINFL